MAASYSFFIIRCIVAFHSFKYLSQSFEIGANETELPLICYTCVNVSNNFICNQYAIDIPCSKGNDYCYTLHVMDSTGTSVVVNKKCANSSECWSAAVGCLKIDSQTICVSCCDELYCNVTVPTNQSDAILSTKRVRLPKRSRIFEAAINFSTNSLYIGHSSYISILAAFVIFCS